jgi:hypothetical protein
MINSFFNKIINFIQVLSSLTFVIWILAIILDVWSEKSERKNDNQSSEISTNQNYKTYDTNIKYSANKDLMNEFRNKADVKEKKIVIVGDIMWQKKPYSMSKKELKEFKEKSKKEGLQDLSFLISEKFLSINWEEANNYCNKSIHENFNNWRLPTRSELGQYYRSDIKVNFDKSMIFWSSTKSEEDGYDYQGMSFDGKGWSIGSTAHVLCVREL